MDEETLRKEFEEWYADTSDYTLGLIESVSTQRKISAEKAWLESARRERERCKKAFSLPPGFIESIATTELIAAADRKAREECAEICSKLCGDDFHDVYDCVSAIRATVPEKDNGD